MAEKAEWTCPKAWQWVLERRWFLLLVRPGKEFVVRDMLVRRGLDALAPATRVFRRLNRYVRGKVDRDYPLMPGYVLVGFPAEGPMAWGRVFPPLGDVEVAEDRHLWRLRGEKLVRAVMGRKGLPDPVNPRRLAQFMVGIGGDLVAPTSHRYMRTHREFACGDMVDVTDGPWRGHVARVESISGEVARLILPLFGIDDMEVPVPLDQLERSA